MAETYKILAQDTAASFEEVTGALQANAVYTVPESTQAAVSAIAVVNSSDADSSYKVGIVKSTDVGTSSEDAYLNRYVTVGGDLYTSPDPHYYSSDGINWELTNQNVPDVGIVNDTLVTETKFVYVGGSGTIVYSEDGTYWNNSRLPYELQDSIRITGIDGLYLAKSGYDDYYAMSNDLITWVIVASPFSNPYAWIERWFTVNGRIYARNTLGDMKYTEDGVSWNDTYVNIQPPDHPYGISHRYLSSAIYNNGIYIFLAEMSYGNHIIVTSSDGINIESTKLFNLYSMVFSASELAVFENNIAFFINFSGNYGSRRVIVSNDNGENWQIIDIPIPGEGYITEIRIPIHHNGEEFVAFIKTYSDMFGDNYVKISSVNGISWNFFNTNPEETVAILSMGNENSKLHNLITSQANIISQAQTIIPTRTIEPNVTDEISGGITLSAGDQIRVYSESEDLTVQVYGVEIS